MPIGWVVRRSVRQATATWSPFLVISVTNLPGTASLLASGPRLHLLNFGHPTDPEPIADDEVPDSWYERTRFLRYE